MATPLYVEFLECMEQARMKKVRPHEVMYYRSEILRVAGRMGSAASYTLVGLMNLGAWNKIGEDDWLSAPVGLMKRYINLASVVVERNHFRQLRSRGLLEFRGRGDRREVRINWKEIDRRVRALSR